MHKKTKGSVAELSVAKHFLEKGWLVLFPYGENSRYDIVAERNGKFLRIQVKYVTPKNGRLEVNCRSSNNWSVKEYTDKEIDMIAAFNPVTNDVYFIPVAMINKSTFNLRTDRCRNNQQLKVHHANQFKDITMTY